VSPSREELFAAYALPERAGRHIRANFVESADGAVTLGGRSGPLGGATDRALLRVLRTMADVVLVGAGTVRVEGYDSVEVGEEDVAWRRRHGLGDQPALAVVSRTAPLADHLAAFDARGWNRILCEGGPLLFGSLLEAGLVDEICLTIAPRVVGGRAGRIARGAAEQDRRFALGHALTDDEGFVFLRYVGS
jgi:riboflavin biosynthesis pyrimidine reductase